jgi:hypothetical protein
MDPSAEVRGGAGSPRPNARYQNTSNELIWRRQKMAAATRNTSPAGAFTDVATV